MKYIKLLANPYYRNLTQNLVLTFIFVAVTPLAITGGILDQFHSSSIRQKTYAQFNELVQKHAQRIDTFLNERLQDIRFVADTFPFEYLRDETNLIDILNNLRNKPKPSLVDLGVVSAQGRQLAYAGPFKLEKADYAEAPWFKTAIQNDTFISDVFSGLRGQPHFIIALRRTSGGQSWILRATVDFETFNDLVENIRIGETGFAFILNQNGEFQTTPKRPIPNSRILFDDALSFSRDKQHEEVLIREKADDVGDQSLYVSTFLKNSDWLLVYKQKTADAFSTIYRTRKWAIWTLVLGCGAIIWIAILLTRQMVIHIAEADYGKEQMNQQVVETGKLAAVGELAAGIAHEINNPVAIMVEEAGWIQDLLEDDALGHSPNLDEFQRALKQIKTQGQRCKEITHKLLSFARKTDARIHTLAVGDLVREVLSIIEQRAKYANVNIETQIAQDLPPVKGSESEMQQVILNLINNAMDAMEKNGGRLSVSVRNHDGEVVIDVADTGAGIPKANIERIFEPFFTTKPVGKGTGLGLSICYGLIKKMGGNIEVESTVGQGTTFHIHLPVDAAAPAED